MGSQLIEVLRQGIWASFSGGWFHDPRTNLFTNTVHFYLWLLLLAFPLTLCIYFTSTLTIWTVYSGLIGCLFLIIKLLNCRFHYLFDTTEATEVPLDKSATEIESPNEVITKSKRERPRNLGLGNVDEIELQVFDNPHDPLSVPTNPGIVHRQRLALAELVGNTPRGTVDPQQLDSSITIGRGRDLKVDVHRKESSSSSSTLSENSNESWNAEFGDKVSTADKAGKSSSSSISTTTPPPINDMVAGTGATSGSMKSRVSFSTSSITPEKKCASLSLTDVDKYSSNASDVKRHDARKKGKHSIKLKQTSSMDAGFLKNDLDSSPNMKQDISGTTEQVPMPSLFNKRPGQLMEHLHRQFPHGIKLMDIIEPLTPEKPKIDEPKTSPEEKAEHSKSRPRGAVVISKSAQSLGSHKIHQDLNLRRCKSEDCKTSASKLLDDDDSSEDDDDDADEAARSRTPLLTQHCDKIVDSDTSWKHRDPKKLIKRVSFNSPTHSEDKNSEARLDEATATADDKAALIPVELCGWNQAGGPFTSEWEFHKTENGKGILEASSDKMKEIFDEDISFIDKDPADSVSIKSNGSSGSHSLVGLDLLFDGAFMNKPESIEFPKLTDRDLSIMKNANTQMQTTSSPKRFNRSGQQRRKYFPPRSAEEERRKRNYYIHTRVPPCDTEAMYQPGWKLERETGVGSRLERLLEESVEASSYGHTGGENIKELSPSSSLSGELGSGDKGAKGLSSAVSLPLTLREHSDEATRQHSGAFLHSATRELKHQLRNLGAQNSLDIASVDRTPSSHRSHSNQFHGLFRPRDESLHFDIDNSTSSINRHSRLRRLALSRRSHDRRRDHPYSPPLSANRRTHVASSHDDYSAGATHYFQDEAGNWNSYTFSEHLNEPSTSNPVAGGSSIKTPSSSESWSSVSSSELGQETGTSRAYPHSSSKRPSLRAITNTSHQTSISGGGSPIPSMPSLATSIREFPSVITPTTALTHAVSGRLNSLPVPGVPGGLPRTTWQRNPRDVLQVLTESFLERRRIPGQYGQGEFHSFDSFSGGRGVSPNQVQKKVYPKVYYVMQPIPKLNIWKVKVWFDRLKLMAVFDRNRSFIETLVAIILAVCVASLGSYMLHQGYYQDLTVVLLCLVMASCQFSLLKSVQPDAASPTHGFNHLVAFSRPIYFCICGGLVYLIQLCLDNEVYNLNYTIYAIDISDKEILLAIQNVTLIIILCFPILFCVGLFPQFNTFLMYTFEQIDIHVFGGNAASSVFASFISNIKNLIAVGLLYGFAYGAIGEARSTQHLLFSIFCGLLVATSYHLSRCASDPSVMWSVLKQHLCPDEDCFGDASSTSGRIKQSADEEGDPLPKKLRDTVNARLKSDLIICSVIGIIVFCLHASTVFTALQPGLTPVLWCVAVFLGFILHYVIPQFRKQLPCLLVSHPVLLPNEYDQFEAREPAKLMWFEKAYIFLTFFEKNIVYPILFISAITEQSEVLGRDDKFGVMFGSLIIVITGLKALRTSFSDLSKHYLIIMFTILFFKFDWEGKSETLLVDFFFMSILFHKFYELWLKLQFVITYIAPWQITWGSAFHAFAQPFSVPHSAMLFLQAVVSSIFSAPLNPFLGSAIFITSYVRPIKFWERDYNTKRVDHSNTRLSAHLEKNPGADDNNLNSIFYEHLTRSLQDSLCGDLILGRWGLVSQGDCFVLASDYLNCLVHIVEVGNGLVTFQMRGLEFRGTYCQQREVEAISEGVEEDDGCCCCEPGHLPHMLSANAAFSQRWLAWEVTVAKYILEGYSIADNSAVSMLQVFDLRKILITYYVKSIIYYTLKADKLIEWLESETIVNSLQNTLDKHYADLDPVFSVNIDEDYDFTASGITRSSFCNIYHSWIQYCVNKRQLRTSSTIDPGRESTIVSLCFALSILGRRALGVAAHSNSLSSVEFFLFGLHALFKGDFRITSQRDEWVFCDMDLLKKVVSPAVRMSLKLHQDHFMCPDEYDDNNTLYDAITYHDTHLVISHEGDPAWRSAVLSGVPALLALRHVLDDGTDEYKIIMLNKRHLSFRVIKLNRECVRGLWAGQQQELVYLRNRDPERGSIQNAKQALRNIINSSCDQPIGYPIYVSPLTTSYADTHVQLCSLVGGPISFSKLKESAVALWRRIRLRCVEGCSSGSSIRHEDTTYGQEGVYSMTSSSVPVVVSSAVNLSGSQSLDGSQIGGSSVGRSSLNRANFSRGSVASNVSGSLGKPSTSTLASLAAGFLTDSNGNSRERSIVERDKDRPPFPDREASKSGSLQRVRIIDANQVYDALNLGRRIDVVWPDETYRMRGGQNYWHNWVPEDGMEGIVVHKWVPGHRDPKSRSITEKTIILLKIDDKYVPIGESGVADLGAEV